MTGNIQKIADGARAIADGAVDGWEELTSNQTDRTGHAAARIASALANGVDPDVLALQATKNSRKNNPDAPQVFFGSDMLTIASFYSANRTRSAMPKKQIGPLIRQQKAADADSQVVHP
ncbi:hypothetical protein D0T25_18490 [Duganella sp. BJB488]|uniref:hypothetical protein n=1 Tax=unclassified Duganella TaxID=2636909 RepID=UPI000E3576ED|nr:MULTISPECIES: hypothetical protein [unclassified Duganella]RFP15127.1 hypothetical protein D0T26_19290 [Duganella sp. BJB489]RFP19681.1 hypothetical protein D0T25_18490 [Duganella sp. BJB488]RFP38071.1 hypothetical protein D0T24_00240 [Duganella sp. BJB480]